MHDELPAEFQNDRSFYIELKLENYEKRRQEKVKMCIEVTFLFDYWLYVPQIGKGKIY
mgnify:FL=1